MTCTPATTVPSLPANAPAIPIPYEGPADPSSFRLLSPSGAEVISTYSKEQWHGLNAVMLVFPSAPAPGQYQLAYKDSCQANAPVNPAADVKAPLVVGPVTPFPTSLGTLEVKNRSVQTKQVWTFSGACYVTIEHVSVDVVFHPSSDIEPFQSVMGFAAALDGGELSGAIDYGRASAGKPMTIASLHAPCDGKDHQTGGLSLGTHSLRLTGHVVGSKAELPEVTTTIDLMCVPAAPATTKDGPDAGPSAPANGAAPSSGASEEDGGCTSAPGQTSGLWPIVVALGAVCLAKRRRR